MPSIPQSLLWISLVVLWLFVLVPMLISKRDAVRRTSDVALATRVLNGGGVHGCCGARRLRPATPATRTGGRPTTTSTRTSTTRSRTRPARRTVVRVAAVEVEQDAEPGYLDVDVIEEDSGALPVGASARAEADPESVESQTDELALDFGEQVDEEPIAEDADEPAARTRARTRRLRRRVRVRGRFVGPGGAVGHRTRARRLAECGAQAPARVEDRRRGRVSASTSSASGCWW